MFNFGFKNQRRGLPTTGLIGKFLASNGLVDSIGLSVSDYADVDHAVRSIFFVDENTLVDAETAVANALSSPLLNRGTMVGSASIGVALYRSGTGYNTLNRAVRYFREGSIFALNWKYAQPSIAIYGPNPSFTYAGNVCDGAGGLTSGVPVHVDDGLYVGPAYTAEGINSAFSGGAIGVTPTGCNCTIAAGITVAIVGGGEGYGYIDINFSGTATGAAYPGFLMGAVSVAEAEAFNLSADLEVLSGDITGYDLRLQLMEYDSGPSLVAAPSTIYTDDGEIEVSGTIAATIVTARPTITASIPVDDVIDFTVRISTAQYTKTAIKHPYLETSTSSTSSADATSSSGGNGVAFEMDSHVRGCFAGEPIGGELITNGGFDSATWWSGSGSAGRLITGGECTFTDATEGVGIYKSGVFAVGERVEITYEVKSLTVGGFKLIVPFSGTPRTEPGVYTESGVATSDTISIGANGITTGAIDNVTSEPYVPLPMTLAMTVKMGAGSTEITSQTNLATVKNSNTGVLYADSAATIKGTDGTSTVSVTVPGGWLAGDVLLVAAQVSSSGTQFGVSAVNLSTACELAEANLKANASWANYDKDFNPLNNLRMAYSGSLPLWLRHVHVSKIQETPADMLSIAGEVIC